MTINHICTKVQPDFNNYTNQNLMPTESHLSARMNMKVKTLVLFNYMPNVDMVSTK